jgi:hypothetical protein
MQRLFKISSNISGLDQNTLHSFISFIVNLINMYKYYYKRYVLLYDYFLTESNTTNVETVMLMLNASGLLKQSDLKPPQLLPRKLSTTMTKSAESEQNQVVFKALNNNLKQIDTTGDVASCLLSEKILYQNLKDYLETFANNQNKKSDLLESIRYDLGDTARQDGENIHLYLNTFYRWFNLVSSFQLILSDLTQFLTDTIGFLNTSNDNNGEEDSLYKRCEFLFIDINGDQNCFHFLSKNVITFFKSPTFVKSVTQLKSTDPFEFSVNLKNKYDYYLFNKVSAFTFEVVYRLVTNYFLKKQKTPALQETLDEMHELFFIEVLAHVEQSLDSPYGLQGFCDFFFQSQDDDEETNLSEKEFETFKSSRLLLFLITSSRKNASQKYLIKMFSILNKLFKIHFQLTEAKSSTLTDKNLKLYTKLCSILSQLNLLSNIDSEFLQAWLSKLSYNKPDAASSLSNDILMNEALTASYTLKQLSIYLVQENENSLNETVPLTILSTLIQLGTNIINTNEGNGFPQLLSLMDVLASAGGGRGHLYLFQACCIWLEHLKSIDMEQVITSLETNGQRDLLNSTSHILSYVCDILNVLRTNSQKTKSGVEQFSFDACLNEDINKIFQSQIVLDFNKDTQKIFDIMQQRLNVSSALTKDNKSPPVKQNETSSAVVARKKNKRRTKIEENIFENENDDMYELDDTEDEDNDLDNVENEDEYDEELEEDDEEEEVDDDNENLYVKETDDENYNEDDEDNEYIYENDEGNNNEDFHLKLEDEEMYRNVEDENENEDEDEDEEEDDDDDDDDDEDDDDDNTYHDFDEKSSYASASSTGNASYSSTKKNMPSNSNSVSAPVRSSNINSNNQNNSG